MKFLAVVLTTLMVSTAHAESALQLLVLRLMKDSFYSGCKTHGLFISGQKELSEVDETACKNMSENYEKYVQEQLQKGKLK